MSGNDKTPRFEAYASEGAEPNSIRVLFFQGSTDLFEREGVTDVRHYKTVKGYVKLVTYNIRLSEMKAQEIIDTWVRGEITVTPLNPPKREIPKKPRRTSQKRGK